MTQLLTLGASFTVSGSDSQPCSSTRWSLKRQRLMRETSLSTKTIKLLTEEQTARLLIITPCYLLMLVLNRGPVVRIHAIDVANLMRKATAQHGGKSVINVRVLIISKPSLIARSSHS